MQENTTKTSAGRLVWLAISTLLLALAAFAGLLLQRNPSIVLYEVF